MNDNNRKILIIVQTLSGGGAERVASVISNNLKGEVKIILYEDKIKYKNNLPKFVLNSPPSDNYFIKLIIFLKRVWKIRNIKKKEKPDYVISFTDGPNLVNILSRINEKIIISVHNNKSNVKGERKIARIIYHFLYKEFYKKADKIICVSKGVKSDIINNFDVPEQKTKVIYNPVDFKEMEKGARENVEEHLDKVFNNPVIINIGRLTKQKGQWHLIRIFKKIKKQIPNAKLLILGDGDLRKYLINLSQNLNLDVFSVWGDKDKDKLEENDVFFFGFVNNPFKYLSKATIFIFPSLWEGFPLVILEAAFFGLPIISSDCSSGPREILAPSTNVNYKTKKPEFADFGIILPVFNGIMYKSTDSLTGIENKWADVICNLLMDKEKMNKYNQASFERSKYFSVKLIMKNWEKLLDNV